MTNNNNDKFKLSLRNLFEELRLNVQVCGNGVDVWYNGYNMLTTATALVLSTTFQNP